MNPTSTAHAIAATNSPLRVNLLPALVNDAIATMSSDLHVELEVDKDVRPLIVRDIGIGMTRAEVVDLTALWPNHVPPRSVGTGVRPSMPPPPRNSSVSSVSVSTRRSWWPTR